jgi:hypothetical protein
LINRREELEKAALDAEKARRREADFSKIKVGNQTLEDAIVNLSYGEKAKANPTLFKKESVVNAIAKNDLVLMREISKNFVRTSGIYSRLCRYMAYLYHYDWYITPYVNSDSVKPEKTIEGFNKSLIYLDNFEVKKNFGDIALKVIINGCYYGCIVRESDRAVLQELPVNYCRSRYNVNGRAAIEFNMKFFDEMYRDAT